MAAEQGRPATIAFFGATGGCTSSALVHALRNRRDCVALARTPSKLRQQLLAQSGVDEAILDAHLTVVPGDATDVAAVKDTLTVKTPGHVVTSIVSGLGGTPSFKFDIFHPFQFFTIDNPHICEQATRTLLDALQQIYREHPRTASRKPSLVFISTTGISQPRGPEDVPFAMRFLYHQVLAVPHVDKRLMESLLRDNVEGKDVARGVLLSDVVGVRPTLLAGTTNADDAAGLDKIRVGRESKPVMGYSIKRADVGHWIWEELIKSGEQRASWANEMVTLTA